MTLSIKQTALMEECRAILIRACATPKQITAFLGAKYKKKGTKPLTNKPSFVILQRVHDNGDDVTKLFEFADEINYFYKVAELKKIRKMRKLRKETL